MVVKDLTEELAEYFNVTDEQAKKYAVKKDAPGIRVAKKELIGEAYIKKEHIFDILFPNNIGFKKITNKKLQKAGADYIIFLPNDENVYIDIKSCIGKDYTMKTEDYVKPTRVIKGQDAIPVEIEQYGVFSNFSSKITDFILYLLFDESGMRYYLVDYHNVIVPISKEHKGKIVVKDGKAYKEQTGKYKWHFSKNGTGLFIKVPAKLI